MLYASEEERKSVCEDGGRDEGVKTIFVVGLGMVGIAFIEKLLNLDEAGRYRIITCGEEMHLAYNRVALTEYLQHRSPEKLYLNQADWYDKQPPSRFQFHTGEGVTFIDAAAHTVTTSLGRSIQYDTCVIATGSEATYPAYAPYERASKTKGVFVYRNIADLDSIISYSSVVASTGGHAVVVGGGLLGLEAAKAVYDLESIKKVSIVNRQNYPLSRQLDNGGGDIVLKRIRALGVDVLTKTTVKDLVTVPATERPSDDSQEVLTGLLLESTTTSSLPSGPEVLECNMVIFAVGITPRDDLARASGLKCYEKGGIVVDDYLKTSAEDVYAVGECASWKGNTYGLIGPGIEMADILSFNLTQTLSASGVSFRPRKMNSPDLSTKLKLMGVDVASYGDYFAEKRQNVGKVSANSTIGRDTTLPTVTSPAESKPAPAALALGLQTDVGKSRTKVWDITPLPTTIAIDSNEPVSTVPKKRHVHGPAEDAAIECLVYRDPFAGVYKKYIFSADGKYLLGGMMVGDTADYIKMVALVKKKKQLDVLPSQFILGNRAKGEEDGADLDGDTQICSCHNVTKDDIAYCVKNGANTLDAVKTKTKAGTGCGGCMPLVTSIFKSEMTKSGQILSNALCSHFPITRTELFSIIKIKQLKSFGEIMKDSGTRPDAVGCEICKPTIGSILSSLWNEDVMKPVHHQNQDTNDRLLANIQRNGTFSVIPRIAAGEITPDKLMVIGRVAKKYNLYTKITGGQRIDLFGAQKPDLPNIWEELIAAGFESGHAYGKALRTVKSCVGTTWCRYGIGDSVGLAVQLEERYKGVRSPHKLKGGVSGCVRECAEAQSKDFGLIATDKGWNIFIGGNGGVNPRHATLFAKDVPPSKVIRIIDRFLMYYIQTADKLTRTARWVEQFDGGIERLKKILLDDELKICDQLEKDMEALVGTFQCEWTGVVNSSERRKQFRQFANTDERPPPLDMITERDQERPADWPKEFTPLRMSESDISVPKEEWEWRLVAKEEDLMPNGAGSTSIAIKYGESQLSVFYIPNRGYFASQQMCPHKRAFVLDHGIVGDDKDGNVYVSCPLHKRNFALEGGECLNDSAYSIISFPVKVVRPTVVSSSEPFPTISPIPSSSPAVNSASSSMPSTRSSSPVSSVSRSSSESSSSSDATSVPSSPASVAVDVEEQPGIYLLLPHTDALDAVLATSKWMVKKATAEAFGKNAATQIEIAGVDDKKLSGCGDGNKRLGSGCAETNGKLDW